ncbi:MAG: hypothetical protein ACLTVY_11815 [Faecalibacterium sp.]
MEWAKAHGAAPAVFAFTPAGR